MKKPWKSGIAFGFGNLIRAGVTFNPTQIPVVSGSTVNLQSCYDCGALLGQERMAAHGQWHRDLHQNFQNVQTPIVSLSTPLFEIRERIEALEKEKEKPVTKVVKRPKKEQGYVQPRRSANPQSTIPMQIPSDSTSGDIFVYDAQANMLRRVQQSQAIPLGPMPTPNNTIETPSGWKYDPNSPVMDSNRLSSSAMDIAHVPYNEQPLFDPTFGGRKGETRTCGWCGKEYTEINSYLCVKTVAAVSKSFETCETCYKQHVA